MRKLLIWLLMTTALNLAALEKLERVIAHRGASYDAPENTAAAISLAIDKKAKIIEFDVRQTKDGELFLFHDSELARLCLREGTFEELTSEEAAKLDVGAWFPKEGSFTDEKPPLLRDAITQCIDGNCIPLIEHKTGSPEAYAKIISELNVTDKVVVQSFNWEFIRSIKAILPNLKTGALGSKKLSARKSELNRLKPDWVGWNHRDIQKTDIDWLKENGYHIAIWTVNDPKRAQQLISWGAHKIITDRPKYIEENLAR